MLKLSSSLVILNRKELRNFDRFFDCLNFSGLDVGGHSRNPLKSPYHSAKDFRLKIILFCV